MTWKHSRKGREFISICEPGKVRKAEAERQFISQAFRSAPPPPQRSVWWNKIKWVFRSIFN